MNPGTRQALSNPEAPGLQTALKRKNYLEGAQRTLTEGTRFSPSHAISQRPSWIRFPTMS